jgi:FKBP-type peptidyl-prolyl cis-trans isomerase SlyD
MKIAQDLVVSIHYTLTNNSGDLLDSSDGQEPLAYIHGHGNIIRGLESALIDKVVGDTFDVKIAPKDAYGTRDKDLEKEVSKDVFKGIEEIEEGMQFRANTDDGQRVFTVTKIDGERITIDGNHPLADVELNFKVEVVDIRKASEEELSHGHVHGPGGHHH